MSGRNDRIIRTHRIKLHGENPHVAGVGRKPFVLQALTKTGQKPDPKDDAASVRSNIFRAVNKSKRKPTLPAFTFKDPTP